MYEWDVGVPTCASMSEPVHPCACAFTCEDMCAHMGKQLDGGERNNDHDQMVSSTRRFPALMTDLLKKMYLSHHMVKGQQLSEDGVSFLGRLDLSLLGIRDPRLPWRGSTHRSSFLGLRCPGPAPSPPQGVTPLSQGRLTSLALALFWLIKEEEPLRAEASPFHPRA